MSESTALFHQLETMVKGANLLELPILWVEQLPDKLGATIESITSLLPLDAEPVTKDCFSCTDAPDFMTALNKLDRKNVLIMGIEAHICVYQTTKGLLEKGYHVEVISDAISSRNADNKQLALSRMQQLGAAITGTEMVLFELQQAAQGDRFKSLLKIIK